MKKQFIAIMVIVGLLLVPINTSAQVFGPVSYVALGDSLAAGQTPNREIDTGYSDLIAQEIARNQPLAFYSKELAFPGFTSADVLKRVQSKEAKPLLQSANVITISAGANDLLRLIQADERSGSLSFQQIPVDHSLNTVRKNMQTMLSDLKKIAPKAQVYVMGYYFAYPHARNSQKGGTARQLDLLNEILAKVAKDAGAQFVPVDPTFGDSVEKVPSPDDVHPNVEGYRAMANSFLNVYAKGAMQVMQSEIPIANPLTFEEIMQVQSESTVTEDDSAVLPSSFLKVEYLAISEIKPIL